LPLSLNTRRFGGGYSGVRVRAAAICRKTWRWWCSGCCRNLIPLGRL